MSQRHPQAPPPQRPSAARLVLGILLLVLSLFLALCGGGILLYGGVGYVMVHESQEDPWVVGSLITGAITAGLALPAVVGGVWALRRSS